MSEPTEQDMDTAYRALWPLTRYRWPRDDEITDDQRGQVERVAAALAAEREKARQPFLALADEIHQRGTDEVAAFDAEPDEHRRNQNASRAATYARCEHLIRQAAEDTP